MPAPEAAGAKIQGSGTKPPDHCRLDVRVTTRSSLEDVELTDGILHVRVNAPPVEGRANERVIHLLADRLRVAKSAVRVIKGATSRNKVISVDGLALGEALRRLGPRP